MELLLRLFFTFCLLTIHGCAAYDEHISGAIPAKRKQFPFFAQLDIIYVEDKKEIPVRCSATLIHWKWILTAALCFPESEETRKQIEANDLGIVFMGPKLRYGGFSKSDVIKEIHIHPSYLQNKQYKEKQMVSPNNIAVAKLKKGFKQRKYITIIQLPSQELDIIKECEMGTVVGIHSINGTEFIIYAASKIKFSNEDDIPLNASNNTQFYSKLAFEGGSGGPYLCYRPHHSKSVPVQYGIALSPIELTGFLVYEALHKHLDFVSKYLTDNVLHENSTKPDIHTVLSIKALNEAANTERSKSCCTIQFEHLYLLFVLLCYFRLCDVSVTL